MNIKIVTDAEGNIVATAYVLPERAKEAPPHMGIIPEPGQHVYEVEAPPEIVAMPAAELHEKYRLEVKAVQAKLIPRQLREAD